MPKVAHRSGAKIERMPMGNVLERLSWDDLRVFQVCAGASSFRDASRILNLSHSTVTRRIERLERVLESQLFHRLPEGGTLTAEGQQLADSAHAMHQSICDLERKRLSRAFGIRGEVTIAVTEGLGSFWVMPRLVEFQRQNPLTTVNLFCAMQSVDVLRLEADMAIQFTRPDRPDLIAVKLGRLHIYPFASKTYLDIYGTPKTYEDMAHHRLVEQIAPSLDGSALARYFRLADPDKVIGVRTNTSSAHLYAIEKGAGIGGLPTFAAALGAPVVPVDIGNGYSLDIWLTYHPDTRQSAYRGAAIDWLKSIFSGAVFPWFRESFIHPSALQSAMPIEADINLGGGFLAVDPILMHRSYAGALKGAGLKQ